MENKIKWEHFEAQKSNIEPHQNFTCSYKKGVEALDELQNS